MRDLEIVRSYIKFLGESSIHVFRKGGNKQITVAECVSSEGAYYPCLRLSISRVQALVENTHSCSRVKGSETNLGEIQTGCLQKYTVAANFDMFCFAIQLMSVQFDLCKIDNIRHGRESQISP